jgi:23S rRNA (cytosine1962-C5)-methyltransferase
MDLPVKSEPRLRLRLNSAAQREIRKGHPWVFSDSISSENRPGKMGEFAIIYDKADKFLGLGLYDPHSPLRVRMLHVGSPIKIDRTWWKDRIESALARRAQFAAERTTGYRCIHGESDRLPGLVLDRYDTTFVLKLYTGAWLPLLPEIIPLLVEVLSPNRIVLRLSRNMSNVANEYKRSDGEVIHGPPLTGPVIFVESGIKFEADVIRGQKTGFFLDQRENRRRVEQLAEGHSVLNTFSFSGGFSLYAARGGASSVTDVDISTHALESARRNFKLNFDDPKIARCRHQTIQGDAFEWLNNGEEKRKFGLVILDPPALARRQAERANALRAYEKLLDGGIKRVERRGLLVASSCSAHVTEAEFFERVRSMARSSGRSFAELFTTAEPVDHPASFPEAKYLKCICLSFEPA